MRHNRDRWIAVRWALPAVMILVVASAASAQNPHVGVRMGIDLDTKNALLSTQATIPVAGRLEFYPSIDVYLPDRGSLTGFNGDLKYRFPSTVGAEVYVGGGVGVLNRSVDDFSDTDLGGKALLGIESRGGRVHPFLEGRALFHDETRMQVIGGLNITLGR